MSRGLSNADRVCNWVLLKNIHTPHTGTRFFVLPCGEMSLRASEERVSLPRRPPGALGLPGQRRGGCCASQHESFLGAGHRAVPVLFNPHNNPRRQKLILSLLYKRGNRGCVR